MRAWAILGHIFVFLRNLYCGGYFGRQVSMAYMTKRKIALPGAKRDPEMGQLNSPWPTYGGSANYTMGLSSTVWPLHMGADLYALAMRANSIPYPMAYATERQSALPDANPEPEMG